MSRVLTGTVVSDKNNKTIVVAIETSKTHPVYKKKYKQTKRYQAHDEKNEARVGDLVSIVETKPFSATKHFALKSVVTKAGIEHKEEEVEV
jgi:small subunit ribosomal protein S17